MVAKRKTSARAKPARQRPISRKKAPIRAARAGKVRLEQPLSQRVEPAFVEQAARLLLQGDSARDAEPIVVDAVARILERVADHARSLEFGASGAERVAAAEALEKVQLLLAKLGEPQRAEVVELVSHHASRLHGLSSGRDGEEAQAIAKAFVASAARVDRSFRRLGHGVVLQELRHLGNGRTKRGKPALGPADVAGVMV